MTDEPQPTPWQLLCAFCKKHWQLLLSVAAALAGVLATRGQGRSLRRRIDIEQDATQVRRQVQQIAIDQGAAAAHAAVQQTYTEELGKLEQKQAEKAETLAQQPQELAAYLVRVTGSAKKPDVGRR